MVGGGAWVRASLPDLTPLFTSLQLSTAFFFFLLVLGVQPQRSTRGVLICSFEFLFFFNAKNSLSGPESGSVHTETGPDRIGSDRGTYRTLYSPSDRIWCIQFRWPKEDCGGAPFSFKIKVIATGVLHPAPRFFFFFFLFFIINMRERER